MFLRNVETHLSVYTVITSKTRDEPSQPWKPKILNSRCTNYFLLDHKTSMTRTLWDLKFSLPPFGMLFFDSNNLALLQPMCDFCSSPY
jgi:hypothetical protein